MPYSKDTWTLGQQMDYGVTAALAGIAHVAKYGHEWLYNFYKVHRDWVNYDKGPFAFIVPATQRDQFATYEMLEILETADVEIHRATAAFSANGKQYPAGSYVSRRRSRTARSPRRCSRSRCIPTCGSSLADRPSRRTTSPGTHCGC